MSPAYNQYREDVGEYGAYGLSSLAKKTRTSNHLQMQYQRQHILSYFKTLSVFVVWGLNPQLPTEPQHLHDVKRNDKDTSKPVATKRTEQKLSFKQALLSPTISTNAFHLTNLFLFSHHHIPFTFIHSVNNTKLPCYTLPLMQHHNFFRNLPPLPAQQSNTQHELAEQKINYSVLISFSEYCHCSCIRDAVLPIFGLSDN